MMVIWMTIRVLSLRIGVVVVLVMAQIRMKNTERVVQEAFFLFLTFFFVFEYRKKGRAKMMKSRDEEWYGYLDADPIVLVAVDRRITP